MWSVVCGDVVIYVLVQCGPRVHPRVHPWLYNINTIKTLQDVCNELHIDFRIFSFLCLVLVVALFHMDVIAFIHLTRNKRVTPRFRTFFRLRSFPWMAVVVERAANNRAHATMVRARRVQQESLHWSRFVSWLVTECCRCTETVVGRRRRWFGVAIAGKLRPCRRMRRISFERKRGRSLSILNDQKSRWEEN